MGGTDTETVTVKVVAVDTGGNNQDTINLSGVGSYQAAYIDGKLQQDTITDGAAYSVMVGGLGNDALNGGDGNDILRGGLGNDLLSGGNGIDLLDFSDAAAGISLTLVQSAAPTPVPNAVTLLNNDDYTNMEGIIGSLTGNDVLTGSASGDVLWGLGGTDTLNGAGGNDTLRGGAGNDTIDGGAGTGDLLDFSDATGALNFTLVQSAVNTNVGAGATPGLGQDIYKNMEGVIGSSFNDSLTGSAGNDILVGGSGADTMTGAGGSDIYRFLNSDASAVDTLDDFAVAPTGSGGDVLDLADILSGVPGLAVAVAADNAGIVDDYLHFDVSGTTAIMFVDAAGTSAGQATATFDVTLGTTDSSLLSDLLTNNQIVV
jgi:Ca2+-binding RTX toxin-like protein